jgi:hypothetical protein
MLAFLFLLLSPLKNCHFHSIRSLVFSVKCPTTIIWRHLYSSRYVLRYLHIVPSRLSPGQKVARVAFALKLRKVLTSAKHKSWYCFVTGAWSWFYSSTDKEYMWAPKGAPTPTRPRQTISSPKRILAFFGRHLGLLRFRFSRKEFVLMPLISARKYSLRSIRTDES